MRFVSSLIIVAASLSPSLALGHDYWLQPASLRLKREGPVDIGLFVGERLTPETEKVFEPERYPRAEVVHGSRTRSLVEGGRKPGAKPIFRATLEGTGGHLIVVDRTASQIELAADKFTRYLQHEGLDGIVAERAKRGESKKPGRERYRRCLKSLVQIGRERDRTYATRTGQTLELIPQSDPAFARPGDVIEVRAEFRGKPLVGAQLQAVSVAKGSSQVATYRTDARGRARVKVDRLGRWALRLVHMVRCADCDGVDWESFWTTYTFQNAE